MTAVAAALLAHWLAAVGLLLGAAAGLLAIAAAESIRSR